MGGGSSKIEKKWRLEYIEELFDKSYEDPFNSFINLELVGAIELFDQLLNIKEFKDDYSRFWYASMLIGITKGCWIAWQRPGYA